MYFLDLINLSFQAACTVDTCPGSAFNSITAAFAAQGYYKQADLLYYLTESELSSIASLIYAISAFAGIVSMVIGNPPRNYMWFFIGPGIYSFLVSTTTTVNGVRWMDLGKGLTEQNQAEVWRIAEPGLKNNSYIRRKGIEVHSTEAPTGGDTAGGAEVSYFFVWVDYFFSSLMEQLVPLTGIYYLEEGGANSNIDSDPVAATSSNKNWSILTDDKWPKVLDITDAHLSNIDLREAFVTFLAGECGDVYKLQIDSSLWLAATKGHGEKVPNSVFKPDPNGDQKPPINVLAGEMAGVLSKKAVPVPDSLSGLLMTGLGSKDHPSFLNSNQCTQDLLNNIKSETFSGGITCDHYLRIIVHGFKYEAINIYSQMMDDAPGEFHNDPKAVVRSLLYGWGIDNLKGKTDPPLTTISKAEELRQEYLVNLILVYLFRNEMAIAPKPLDDIRNSSSERVQGYVDTQVRTVGSKTKYAEVYSWAKMMPYFQGIMLYVLAMAYPFVALMVIVPGWHKIIVTWITFWIWVKSWDLGFAVVKTIERSIWAMLGNDPSAAYVNAKVLVLANYMPYKPTCNSAGGELGNCMIPKIDFSGPECGLDTMEKTFTALGRVLGLAGNMDLDLTNSYYIYIMAALYFAVPGVTGQLVLGAKSGAANLVGGAIQGFGDANKGAAGAGSQSHLANAVQSNMGAIGQASYAKASKGFATQALDSQNMSADAGLASQAMNTKSQLASNYGGAMERRNQSLASQTSPIESGGVVAGLGAKAVSSSIGGADALATMMSTPDPAGGASSPSGASSPGGASGGGSAGGGSPGGGTLFPGLNASKKAAGALSKGDKAAVAAAAELKNRATQPVLGAVNDINAANSDRMVGSFDEQGQSTQSQTHGTRLGGYANYRGETGASRASMRMGNQMGAYATIAAGSMGGSMVKQLPNATQDSAMSGILNSYQGDGSGNASLLDIKDKNGNQINTDARGSANHFQAGGAFSQKLDGHVKGMKPMAGAAVNAAYGGGYSSDVGSKISDSDFRAKDTSAFKADPIRDIK